MVLLHQIEDHKAGMANSYSRMTAQEPYLEIRPFFLLCHGVPLASGLESHFTTQ